MKNQENKQVKNCKTEVTISGLLLSAIVAIFGTILLFCVGGLAIGLVHGNIIARVITIMIALFVATLVLVSRKSSED